MSEVRLRLKDRCFICDKLDSEEYDYMCHVQYSVTHEEEMKRLFLSKGFCNGHFWKIAFLTSPESVSKMAILLIENGKIPTGCLICDYLLSKEEAFLDEFRKEMAAGSPETSTVSTKPLCEPHFMLAGNGLDAYSLKYLAGIHTDHNRQLLGELKSFVAKRENRSARTADEETAWWRVVERLVGRKGSVR
ncbi:MAG: hypothetical protein M0Z52_12360 [Actinomycetota bacterium]|nr:hypothetical protein [Actinomycetota bacterium]